MVEKGPKRGVIDEAIGQFNKAATELQRTEFRRPTNPGEWQRMNKKPPLRDYEKLFAAVVPMIKAFTTVGHSADRLSLSAKLNPDALGILRTFAYSVAVLAVRRESPALIAQGLIAVAILGGVDDVRDLTFYLAMLHHSARKVGIDPQPLFGEVATLTPSIALQAEMRGFPLRTPGDRNLRAFRLRETGTGEGFDFVQDA